MVSGEEKQSFKRATMLPNVVSCVDPLDLRPAVDAIVAEIHQRSRPGRPLVVLMGEGHEEPASKILQQIVMARLLADKAAAPKIAYGIEKPHDYLEWILKRAFSISVDDSTRGKISAADRDGQHLLPVFHAAIMPPESPVTTRNIMDFCWNSEISVRANDAVGGQHLNQSDPQTRAAVERYAPDRLDTPIPSYEEPLGVEIRNRIIADNMIAHAKDSGADVYFQSTGRGHIFGHGPQGKEFRHSLSAILNEGDVDVLPVFIASDSCGVETIPAEATGMVNKSIVIYGISKATFNLGSPPGAEAAFLEEINRHSGGEIGLSENSDEFRSQVFSWVKSEIPAWLAELGPSAG